MAVREMIVGMTTLSDDGTVDIMPSILGDEWVVHNIYVPVGKAVEIWRKNSSGRYIFIMQTYCSLIGEFNFHCNQDEYLMLKNVSGETIDVSADGIVVDDA